MEIGIFAWLKENQVFSGLAVTMMGAVGYILKKWLFGAGDTDVTPISDSLPSITINNSNSQGTGALTPAMTSQARQRRDVRILFVDDDTKFKLVKIMRAAGWSNVQIKRDIKDLESSEVRDTQIFFIDIQGVGKALEFADEGLGLSLAIKQKYPDKKVVIYSAQTDGDRFHKALQKADGSLAKNAEPYEFIALLEELTGV